MNSKNIFKVFASLLIVIVVIEIVLAHDNGVSLKTGFPGEGNCTGCHAGTANNGAGSITVSCATMPGWIYSPGVIYPITVTVTRTGSTTFGFDLEALKPNGANGGTLTLSNTVITKLLTSSGRTNVTHKIDQAGTGTFTFTFNWTAPPLGTGTVTFWAAGLAGNNNNANTGDFTYTTNQPLTEETPRTITTGTINGSPFCYGDTAIAVSYGITGTFNAGNVFTAQLSDATGSFASPLNLGTDTTINSGYIISSMALPSVSGNGYRIRVVSSSPVITGSDNGVNLSIYSCAAPSIATSWISGSPFCDSSEYHLAVPFSSSGNFTGAFSAELSDSSGSFNAATIIGSDTASPIPAIIPGTMVAGSLYRIRVVNSSPAIIGIDNGTDLNINNCNTVSISNVFAGPYCSNTTYEVIIPFISTGQMTGIYNVELSDSSGSFTGQPLVFGYGSVSPIHATLPSGVLTGTNYKVKLVNVNNGIKSNVSNSIKINVCGAAGINKLKESLNFEIVPNPNKGNFMLRFNNEVHEASIVIMDVIGNIIVQEKISNDSKNNLIQLNFDFLKPGIYFIQFKTDNYIVSKKLILE